MECAILGGSALLHLALFNSLGGDPRGDGAKLKSCYLSHLHLSVSVTSCLIYWLTQPVELSNAKWMVEGPSGWNSDWMRRTISFSVGYLINDLFMMIKYPVVGGTDMVVHHIICILFWGSGLLDRLGTEKHPPCVPNSSAHAAANVPRSCKLRGGSFLPHPICSPGIVCVFVCVQVLHTVPLSALCGGAIDAVSEPAVAVSQRQGLRDVPSAPPQTHKSLCRARWREVCCCSCSRA